MSNDYRIVSIEVGPHFLTFYVDPKPQGLHHKVYKSFCDMYPELSEIQQKDFTHQAGDIPIYHFGGCPKVDQKREHWKHFHIRTLGRPTAEDLQKALAAVKRHADISSYLVEFMEEPPYREAPTTVKEYLEFIQDLKRGN